MEALEPVDEDITIDDYVCETTHFAIFGADLL